MPALDGVRGVAILLVLASHTPWIGHWAAFGWIGVDLFFVLSGYLITGVLLDGTSRPHRARTFYLRRVLRIMPLYYATLVLVLIVCPLGGAAYDRIAAHQAWLWTYSVNWIMAFHEASFFTYTAHFWSLAVEEQFYLLWPLVVWHLSRTAAIGVAWAMVAGALVFRLALAAAGTGWLARYSLTPCRMDALAVGALLAFWLRDADDPAAVAKRVSRIALPAVVVLAVVVAYDQGITDRGLPIDGHDQIQCAGVDVRVAGGSGDGQTVAYPGVGVPDRRWRL